MLQQSTSEAQLQANDPLIEAIGELARRYGLAFSPALLDSLARDGEGRLPFHQVAPALEHAGLDYDIRDHAKLPTRGDHYPALIGLDEGRAAVVHHLLHTISDPKNTVLIVGYMAANTLGRRIKEKHRQVKIFGNSVILRAEVEEIRALSSHADYIEMGEYVQKMDLKKLKKIFLVHGEEESQAKFKEYLLNIGVAGVEIVEYGNTYDLL